MDEKEELLRVGKYNSKFNDILGINIKELDIYCSEGLKVHMIKRKHSNCLRYIDCIPDIIENPSYIGVNPNEKGSSIELIKRYEENVMIGIKLDIDREYLYVSTMHDIHESKIKRRLYSGRIKEYGVDNEEEK